MLGSKTVVASLAVYLCFSSITVYSWQTQQTARWRRWWWWLIEVKWHSPCCLPVVRRWCREANMLVDRQLIFGTNTMLCYWLSDMTLSLCSLMSLWNVWTLQATSRIMARKKPVGDFSTSPGVFNWWNHKIHVGIKLLYTSQAIISSHRKRCQRLSNPL